MMAALVRWATRLLVPMEARLEALPAGAAQLEADADAARNGADDGALDPTDILDIGDERGMRLDIDCSQECDAVDRQIAHPAGMLGPVGQHEAPEHDAGAMLGLSRIAVLGRQ